jgi:putative methyltransferase (TIGR04325 family)
MWREAYIWKIGKKLMKLKQHIRQLIEKTPLVSGYYYYYWIFPRTPNQFRGVYLSFSQALKAIPRSIKTTYDSTRNEVDVEWEMERVETIDNDDFHLLEPLQEAFKDSTRVFDLGGDTGKAYYSYRKHISYPESLEWIVCDLPAAVEIGNQLMKKMGSQGLSFTTDFEKAEQAEILLTSGTLQYLEPSLPQLLENLKNHPRHVIVNRVPFYEGEEYITLQNLIDSYVPYKIQDRAKFINSMFELGYDLIDVWQKNRTINIPFHPNRFVGAYHGFYFRRK